MVLKCSLWIGSSCIRSAAVRTKKPPAVKKAARKELKGKVPTAASSDSPPFAGGAGEEPPAPPSLAAKKVVARPVEYPSSWARHGLARGALAGGAGGGWYPFGSGTPALAATAASAVLSALVAPWMEATDRALAPRHEVSLLNRSCTESDGDDDEEEEEEDAVMETSEPERQAETSAAEAGSGSEPAAPPPRVTLMASAVRTKEAPEDPGTERGSPGCPLSICFCLFVF